MLYIRRLLQDSHANRSETSLSRQLIPSDQFLMLNWNVWATTAMEVSFKNVPTEMKMNQYEG